MRGVLAGCARWTVERGDALDVLRSLPADAVHAVVTDPPSSISFMGKTWDSDKGGRAEWCAWLTGIMREALRVTRPGGWAFVWALPRRSHWTATAVEDAGWEIRDTFFHLFGTGFPKGYLKGAPERWKHVGTALKPVAECWIIARRPFEGSTSRNLDEHGTGGFNIAGCRSASGNGRYPPHLALTHAPECVSVGARRVKTGKAKRTQFGGFNFGSVDRPKPPMDDLTYADDDGKETVDLWACVPGCPVRDADADGSAPSRFWPTFAYVPKPSAAERNKGCEGLDPRDWREGARQCTPRSGQLYEHVGRKGKPRPNNHPTVKPVKLMRLFARLVCPAPDSIIFDPFAGSGTTGVGAVLEGHRFIGVEQDEYYVEVSRRRLGAESPKDVDPIPLR